MPQIPSPQEILLQIAKVLFAFFGEYWWIIFPPALFFIFLEVWLLAIRTRWVSALPWITLEIRIPKDIEKTPKAMEQIFSGMHALYDPPNPMEKWWQGRIQEWLSFEMVGDASGIHFYARTIKKFRNLVEAQVYAQFPQAEIVEVEDYTEKFPPTIPNDEYDLWGTEMMFLQPDAYPIRMYFEFEEAQEEKRIDPIASLSEVMSGLKPGEAIWLQFIIRPADPGWVKKGEAVVAKLIGKKPAGKGLLGFTFGEFIANLLRAPFEHPTWGAEKEDRAPESLMLFLSPGERLKVEAIEKKIAKLGFETMIRWIYIGRKDIFNKQYIGSILSYFRHFNTMNLNGFKLNKHVAPKIRYWWYFKARREFLRKRAILSWYKSRAMIANARKQQKIVMNTEELATIFHYPTIFVEAPGIHRVEYKKGAPPPTLPVGE